MCICSPPSSLARTHTHAHTHTHSNNPLLDTLTSLSPLTTPTLCLLSNSLSLSLSLSLSSLILWLLWGSSLYIYPVIFQTATTIGPLSLARLHHVGATQHECQNRWTTGTGGGVFFLTIFFSRYMRGNMVKHEASSEGWRYCLKRFPSFFLFFHVFLCVGAHHQW